MEPGAALAQPRSTPNYNGNAVFLNILLKDDDKVAKMEKDHFSHGSVASLQPSQF
jgi:hypothetical protein